MYVFQSGSMTAAATCIASQKKAITVLGGTTGLDDFGPDLEQLRQFPIHADEL